MNKEDIEYIANVLRRGTITWSGRTRCLNRSRYKAPEGKGGREIWARDCDGCQTRYLLKDGLLEVDHIKEVGGFGGDWNDFVRRLYCEDSNLQALCFSCHSKKTNSFNAALRFERKNKS